MTTHPPVYAPDGTAHRIPDWRRPMGLIVGYLPREHGDMYMRKLYSVDNTYLGPWKVQASRWLMWEDGRGALAERHPSVMSTGVFRCLRRPRWRRGRRP